MRNLPEAFSNLILQPEQAHFTEPGFTPRMYRRAQVKISLELLTEIIKRAAGDDLPRDTEAIGAEVDLSQRVLKLHLRSEEFEGVCEMGEAPVMDISYV